MDFKIREVRMAQGPKKLLRERETYFRLMRQGLSNDQACRIVGVNPKTGRRWRKAEDGTSGSAGGAAFYPRGHQRAAVKRP